MAGPDLALARGVLPVEEEDSEDMLGNDGGGEELLLSCKLR